MVQTEIAYQGQLRTQGTHGPSGATIITDAPVDNRGKGEAFSPTDLVGVALGSCVLTLMGITAQDKGWDLGETQVSVAKTMKATPMRHIARLDVNIRIPGDWDSEQIEALEATARGCPVMASLGERVDVRMNFQWGPL
ncbi:MAG: OsmC family protein [Planctomycetota bacterium]|nr:OsmC family protein [Planctomycetota bacterium]